MATAKAEKPKKSLDYILQDKKALDELLEETGGELNEALESFLTEVYGNIETKVDNVAGLIRHLELEASNYEAYARDFSEKKKARENQVKKIKEHFKMLMLYRKVDKLEGEAFTLAIQKNGGLAPLRFYEPWDQKFSEESFTVIDDEYASKVPESVVKTVKVLDKAKLREELATGTVMEFATLTEPGTHLRIK